MISFSFLVNSENGLSREILYCLHKNSNSCQSRFFESTIFLKKRIAPCLIERFSSGTIISLAASRLIPKPLHSLQQPSGALNENKRGSSFGTEKPHFGHEWSEDSNFSSLSLKNTTYPFEKSTASSIDSVSLERISSLIMTRSITISIS